jgi:hypothetical protein
LHLFCLFQVHIENSIPESIWAIKRENIAQDMHDLGAGYRQVLRDGWAATSTKQMQRVEGKPIGVSMLALHRSE